MAEYMNELPPERPEGYMWFDKKRGVYWRKREGKMEEFEPTEAEAQEVFRRMRERHAAGFQK